MLDTQWVIIFLRLALNCDFPILEALHFVIYLPTTRDIWSRLSDQCTFDTLFKEFHDILNSVPNWNSSTHELVLGPCISGWSFRDKQTRHYCEVIDTTDHIGLVERRTIGYKTEGFFLLFFYKPSKVITEASINSMPISKDGLSKMSFKQQILWMNSKL